jgi:hypothetical protein
MKAEGDRGRPRADGVDGGTHFERSAAEPDLHLDAVREWESLEQLGRGEIQRRHQVSAVAISHRLALRPSTAGRQQAVDRQ